MPSFRLRKAQAQDDFELLEHELLADLPPEEREIERMQNVIATGRKRVERLQGLLERAEARLAELEWRREAAAVQRAANGDEGGSGKQPVHEGARIVATQMLRAGQGDDQIEAYLQDIFELGDPHAVVEEARASGAAG
jgi:hypothetical protein